MQTTVRLDDEFNRIVRITMANRRIKSLQEAMIQALEAWVQQDARPKPAPVAAAPGGGYPAAHRDAHELLEEILRDGTPDQAGWITGNLKTFVAAIRANPKPASSKRAG